MKNVFYIFFAGIMLLALSAKAQWWPVSKLVPTQVNTTNLCLNYDGYAWEEQIDSATTAIYYRSMSWGRYEPVRILYTPGVKYTNPQISDWPSGRVFFETNINGNSDIYVIVVDVAGNPVGEMQPLVTSPADDHGFCYNSSNWPCQVAWLEDETLKVGNLNQNNNQFSVSGIITMDSLNCSSPAWFINSLFWIKNDDSFDVVKASTYGAFGWSTPNDIDTANQIQALKNTSFNYLHLQWSFKEDTNWFMMIYFVDYYMSFVVPEVSQAHPFDFDVCDIGVGVKSTDGYWGPNYFQAYVKNINGYDEVFLNLDEGTDLYYNFSNMGANCRNPQFFCGETVGQSTFMFYLTWEAFVDGSWQIYYSKMPITWGGIEENENNLIKNLVISPNPFHNNLQICFDLEKPASVVIDLIDIHGRLLQNLCSGKYDGGSISKQFNLAGSSISGPCLMRFNIEGSYSFSKVIRVK